MGFPCIMQSVAACSTCQRAPATCWHLGPGRFLLCCRGRRLATPLSLPSLPVLMPLHTHEQAVWELYPGKAPCNHLHQTILPWHDGEMAAVLVICTRGRSYSMLTTFVACNQSNVISSAIHCVLSFQMILPCLGSLPAAANRSRSHQRHQPAEASSNRSIRNTQNPLGAVSDAS